MLQTGAGARVLRACYSCAGLCFSLSSSSAFPVSLDVPGTSEYRSGTCTRHFRRAIYIYYIYYIYISPPHVFFFSCFHGNQCSTVRSSCFLFDAVGTEKLSAHVGVKRRVYGHARMFVVSATLERTFTSHNEKTRKRYVNICRQGKARL